MDRVQAGGPIKMHNNVAVFVSGIPRPEVPLSDKRDIGPKNGFRASASRILRLWRREGLKVPQKQRKKRRLDKGKNCCHRQRAEHKDHVWAWDFVFDKTTGGTQLKWLSIVDEYTRECLALKCARSVL